MRTVRQDERIITRDDVARLAGTSTAVVSYVVNGGPRPVAKATKERVFAAIEQLGYRPNGLARALRLQKSLVLGLLVPDVSNPFFAEFAKIVENVAFADGYRLLIGNTSNDADQEAFYLNAFASHQIDGLLLVSVGNRVDELLEAARLRCPIVIVDRLLPNFRAAMISVDNEWGGFAATSHLIEHGHRYIACVGGPTDLNSSTERQRGWSRALVEAGLPADPALYVGSSFDRLGGYEATTELLARKQVPTAIFASTDVQAIGALRAVADAGLSVPRDLALVSFDGVREAAFTVPRLTTVAQPIARLGTRAIACLLEQVRTGVPKTTVEILPVELVIGESCGCSIDGGSANDRAGEQPFSIDKRSPKP